MYHKKNRHSTSVIFILYKPLEKEHQQSSMGVNLWAICNLFTFNVSDHRYSREQSCIDWCSFVKPFHVGQDHRLTYSTSCRLIVY